MTGPGGCDGGRNLGGMMAVIIDDQITRRFIVNLKSASRTAKSLERGDDIVERQAHFEGKGDYGKSIHRVVRAGDL